MRPLSLDRMLQAHRDTASHLECLFRQIRTRAARRTIARRSKARQFGAGTTTWSPADERVYRAELDALAFARASEIDTLTRKLERQERAIDMTTRRLCHADVHD